MSQRQVRIVVFIVVTGALVLVLVSSSSAAPISEGRHLDPTDLSLNVMSGPAYLELLKRYGLLPPVQETEATAPETVCLEPRYLGASMVTDADHSVEPSMVTTTQGGQTYKIVTYIYGSSPDQLFFSSFLTSGGPSQELPRDPSYQLYFDPWLDANNSGGRVVPGRVYNAGVMTSGAGNPGPTAIGVWYSDTQGASWSSPIPAASETTAISYFLDAPSLTVSTATNSLGHVYVSYTRYHIPAHPTDNYVWIAKSTNGGQTWTRAQVGGNSSVGNSQVLVDPATGYVYAVWTDFGVTPNAIKMSKSTNSGTSWSTPETAATATYDFLGGNDSGTLSNLVPAVTRVMARFNPVSGRVEVVWHERQAPLPSKKTTVYFTSKSTSGWQPKLQLNDSSTEDPFMPAIDFDSSRTALVAWYSQNVTYRIKDQKLTSTGTKIGSSFSVDQCEGNASNYPNQFLGDYHALRSLPTGAPEGKWAVSAADHPNPAPGVYADIWLFYRN